MLCTALHLLNKVSCIFIVGVNFNYCCCYPSKQLTIIKQDIASKNAVETRNRFTASLRLIFL